MKTRPRRAHVIHYSVAEDDRHPRLKQLVGKEYFEEMEWSGMPLDERVALVHVLKLRHLRGLHVFESRGDLSDADLARLRGRQQVVSLSLRGSRVIDNHLAHVVSLTELKILHLEFAHVTDAGLAQLASLTKLEELSLYGTRIGDDGLAHLRGLTKLNCLGLSNSLVSHFSVHISIRLAIPRHLRSCCRHPPTTIDAHQSVARRLSIWQIVGT
jgi:hypothetical protein